MLTAAQVQELTERMLKSSGRRIDISRPFVDAMLPEGHRLHVVLEAISRGFTAVNATQPPTECHPSVTRTLPTRSRRSKRREHS